MTSDSADFTTSKPGVAPRWRRLVAWPVLLGLAWIVYEFTTQSALGIVVVSLKFGWEDFCTAYWLRRIDRHAGRGRTCFLAYVACGLFRAGFIACLLTGILQISMFPHELQRQGKPVPNQILTQIVVAGATVTCTLVLAGLLGLLALFSAMRHHVKV